MKARTLTYDLGGHWRNGRGQAPCPKCQPERRNDQRALSIAEANGSILLYCFKGGCSFVDIANAVVRVGVFGIDAYIEIVVNSV